MKVRIRGRGVELTEALRAHVERRLGVALGRFGDRVRGVNVAFSDLDGLWGRAGRRCRIDVGLRSSAVSVQGTDIDPLVAVDHAAERVSRSVDDALQRERARSHAPQSGSTRLAVKEAPGNV